VADIGFLEIKNRHKDEMKKERKNSNYRKTKHLATLTEETRQDADKQSTVHSERLHNEVSK